MLSCPSSDARKTRTAHAHSLTSAHFSGVKPSGVLVVTTPGQAHSTSLQLSPQLQSSKKSMSL